MDKINVFVDRLKKIGIKVELWTNFPWIYLHKVNGSLINERFKAEYGFTIAFHPIRDGDDFKFTDIKEIFKIIRKYRLTDDELYNVYMDGWNHALNSIDKKQYNDKLLQYAYNSGYIDCIVGDGIRVVDYRTKEEIVTLIRNNI